MASNANIGLRIGGTNLQVAVLYGDEVLRVVSDEIRFRDVCEARAGGSYVRSDMYELVANQVLDCITRIGLSVPQFIKDNGGFRILVSFAGPMSLDGHLVFRPKSIPCMHTWFPLAEELSEHLCCALNCSRETASVQTWMDGTTSVFAETSPNGTCPGERDAMVVISGTGVGAGFMKDGKSFVGQGINGMLGEIGYFLMTTSNGQYKYMAYETHGDIGRFISGKPLNVFRHRFCVEGVLKSFIEYTERRGDGRPIAGLKGWACRGRMSHATLVRLSQELIDRIANGDRIALSFLDDLADGFCSGIASFVVHPRHIGEKFTRNIVLVGSLSCFLGVFSSPLESRMREALYRKLCEACVSRRIASEICEGFRFSKMSSTTREFIGLARLGRMKCTAV